MHTILGLGSARQLSVLRAAPLPANSLLHLRATSGSRPATCPWVAGTVPAAAVAAHWRRASSTSTMTSSSSEPIDERTASQPVPPQTPPPALRSPPILRPWSLIPTAPKYLGLAGLLPFLGTALGAYTCVPTDIMGFQMLQATYGASILSFMGAIHWGTAMAAVGPPSTVTSRYMLSTLPCLAGFVSLNLPPDLALLVQSAGFTALAVWDTRAWKRHEVPEWYPTLRYVLTGVVVATLGGTWWAGKRPIKTLEFELGQVPEKKSG